MFYYKTYLFIPEFSKGFDDHFLNINTNEFKKICYFSLSFVLDSLIANNEHRSTVFQKRMPSCTVIVKCNSEGVLESRT
jgi:hypothetical protein